MFNEKYQFDERGCAGKEKKNDKTYKVMQKSRILTNKFKKKLVRNGMYRKIHVVTSLDILQIYMS